VTLRDRLAAEFTTLLSHVPAGTITPTSKVGHVAGRLTVRTDGGWTIELGVFGAVARRAVPGGGEEVIAWECGRVTSRRVLRLGEEEPNPRTGRRYGR
jgi:hypothetical protein